MDGLNESWSDVASSNQQLQTLKKVFCNVCDSLISYKSDLRVEGTVGITIDNGPVLLLHFSDLLSKSLQSNESVRDKTISSSNLRSPEPQYDCGKDINSDDPIDFSVTVNSASVKSEKVDFDCYPNEDDYTVGRVEQRHFDARKICNIESVVGGSDGRNISLPLFNRSNSGSKQNPGGINSSQKMTNSRARLKNQVVANSSNSVESLESQSSAFRKDDYTVTPVIHRSEVTQNEMKNTKSNRKRSRESTPNLLRELLLQKNPISLNVSAGYSDDLCKQKRNTPVTKRKSTVLSETKSAVSLPPATEKPLLRQILSMTECKPNLETLLTEPICEQVPPPHPPNPEASTIQPSGQTDTNFKFSKMLHQMVDRCKTDTQSNKEISLDGNQINLYSTVNDSTHDASLNCEGFTETMSNVRLKEELIDVGYEECAELRTNWNRQSEVCIFFWLRH